MFLFFCQLNINQLYLLFFFVGQNYVKSVKYPLGIGRLMQ